MKTMEKLRATWSKKEESIVYHYPLGFQTKCDAAFLSGHITDAFARELEKRGYDKTTLRFSVEPKKGNEDFASQRGDPMTELDRLRETNKKLKDCVELMHSILNNGSMIVETPNEGALMKAMELAGYPVTPEECHRDIERDYKFRVDEKTEQGDTDGDS